MKKVSYQQYIVLGLTRLGLPKFFLASNQHYLHLRRWPQLHCSASHYSTTSPVSLVGFVNHIRIFIGLLGSMNLLTLRHCTRSVYEPPWTASCASKTL